jgi:hypothetical protein
MPYLLKLAGLSSPLCRALTTGLANKISQVRNLTNKRAVSLFLTYISWRVSPLPCARPSQLAWPIRFHR